METTLRSKTKSITIGHGLPFVMIGERINPSGRKKLGAEMAAGDFSRVQRDAAAQVAAGAHMLDVNAGVPIADEAALLVSAIQAVGAVTDAPLVLDSSVVEALAAGLAAYDGKALVNSVTGEDERLELVLPLVKQYGAAVIGMANDETGISSEPEYRLGVARKILQRAQDHGIPPEDVLIDPLALTIAADPEAVQVTLRTMRLIRDELGLNMVCGASNTSFGLPERSALNAAYLSMAMVCGLTAAITDPTNPVIRQAVLASDVLLGHDAYAVAWIADFPQPASEYCATVKYSVTFLPQNIITHVPEGTTVFNAANWAGLPIDSTCGGRGTCGKCKVRLLAGAECGITDADHKYLSVAELEAGWRLSCRSAVHSECVAEVPRLMTSPKAALLGYGQHVILDPNVSKVHLILVEPTLEDQRSDLVRLTAALRDESYEVRVDPGVWRALPIVLRANDFDVTAVIVGDELIAIEPGDTSGWAYGLAVDIGTTTVVGAIVNLLTGAVEAVKSTLNGQASFGADVISRASFTMMEPDGLAQLTERILTTINGLLQELSAMSGVRLDQIYEAVVVGNATMLHLLLGIHPEPISVAPFIPALSEAVTLPAATVGILLHPQARLTTLPHMGAYVGADIVSGVLATGLARNKDGKRRLYIDVGTNGEIVLGSIQRALSTAAPAGPAFEGAQIQAGMRASDGAIEGVQITPAGVTLQIIGGDLPPVGICGSGLVDAVAELVKVGLVDISGKLLRPDDARAAGISEALISRLVTLDRGVRAFRLSDAAENILLTQPDVRALQFAKGAIAAGVEVLLAEMGWTADDLDEVLLAGSFGSYINPGSARAIGLVPWVPLDRIVAVGNAAGEGAKISLLSFREREAANRLPDFIEYLELSGRTDFNDIFMDVLAFPPQAIPAPAQAQGVVS